MKHLLTILFFAVFATTSAQKLGMVKVATMQVNGTTDEWRWQVIEPLKVSDTLEVMVDSFLKKDGQIIGYKTAAGIVLLKEKPRPAPAYNGGIDTIGWFITDIPDAKWIRKTVHRSRKSKKPAPRTKMRVRYEYEALPPVQTYETVQYFRGYGIVDDRGGEYIVLRNPRGSFYKRRVRIN